MRLKAALLSLCTALPAAAGPGDGVATVDVLPGWRAESGVHMSALRIRLAPGWKTYWRSPGDAGIPPRFGWDGSTNLASVRIHWPRPGVYEINGMRSIGYYGEVILPIELVPQRPGEPIVLNAEIEMGVCKDICVPMGTHVSAEIPLQGADDPAIRAALADRPVDGRAAGVARVACDVEPIADGLQLTARIDMPRIGANEVAVFELPDQAIWVSESQGHRDGQRLTARSDLVPPSGTPFLLDRSQVRITVLGEGRAVEMWGCPSG